MPKFDHEPAAAAVTALLDTITDEQLSAPTPCPGLPVAALLDHLLGLSLAFTWAAGKSVPDEFRGAAPGPGQSTGADLDPKWRTLLPERLDRLVEAWREPAAWAGMTEAGGVTMPGEVTAVVALDELLMHGWDLARATGQPYAAAPASAEIVMGFLIESAAPQSAGMRAGLFGPVVEVPAGAAAFDRALGLAGRDPAWRPPSAR